MKKTLILIVALFGVAAFADTPVPTQDFWSQLAGFIGGLKGISILGGVAALSQLILGFSNSSLGDIEGKYKLLIVSAASMVGSILTLVASGVSWDAALFSGTGLTLIQNFIYQLHRQISTRSTRLPLPPIK